jgi:hypothetical protein
LLGNDSVNTFPTNSHDHGNDYARNNRGIVGIGVLCLVHEEAIRIKKLNSSFLAVERAKRRLKLPSWVRTEAEKYMALRAVARQTPSEDIEGCMCAVA